MMQAKVPRFLIVSAVIHKRVGDKYGGYTPYVREMNLWFKYVNKVRVIAPVTCKPLDPLESFYQHPDIQFVSVPALEFTGVKKALKSFLLLPVVLFRLFQGMVWASHVHLRCPSNMGLLGALLQVCFPFKPKTVKYANNWDWNSSQPLSYRLQQHLLRSQFFTRQTRVLVYGDWNERSPNIYPFFTASYTRDKDIKVNPRDLLPGSTDIRLLFVGTLTSNKRPMECIQTLEILRAKGVKASLDIIGDGVQNQELNQYVVSRGLTTSSRFQGKKNPDDVIDFFKAAHFLIFLSQSEGWPKVVAEAMWWGCLPVTTNVSCVGQMVGNDERGILVSPDPGTVADKILALKGNPILYRKMCEAAMEWSREYTLERFDDEISRLLKL